MDRLARNAMLAKQAGMSYGQWKALQPIVPVEKMEMKEPPKGWIKCEYCKKPFKPFNSMQKYCEVYCRERGYYEKRSENQREKARERVRKCRMKKKEEE